MRSPRRGEPNPTGRARTAGGRRTVRARYCWSLWLLAVAAGCTALEESWLTNEPFAGAVPREVRAEFTGNASVANGTLRTAIRADMLGLSQGLDAEAAAWDAADAIAEYYRSQGFPDASATFRVDGPTVRLGEPDLVVVHFAVEEGPAVTVARLRLEGNRQFDDAELLSLWARRNSGAFGLGDPWFVHAELRSFAIAIRDFYRSRGFLEAAVDGPDVEREPGAATASATLRVTEGRRFHFGAVTVAPALRAALGPALPRLPTGDPFSTLRAQEFLLAIRSALLRRGHPDPNVGTAPLPDVTQLAAPRIDLDVGGDPGPRVDYGAIEVAGNERTRTSVITGKLGFAEGEAFDGLAEQETVGRLYRTGLFKQVAIEHGPIADGRMPVQVRVEELDAQAIEALVGYGSYEQLRAGLRWEDRNLFGSGRELAVETRVSQKGYRGSATVTDRDLIGHEVTGSLGGEVFSREYPSYQDRAYGVTTSLRRSLGELAVARAGYSYLEHDTTSFVQGVPPTVEDYSDGSVFVELRRDTRDNIVLPASGTAAYVRADFTNELFGADFDFNRLRAGVAWIVALGEDTRIGVDAEAGWLWPGIASTGVPVAERFFNGGYDTVRSYEQDELGPKDAVGNPLGGEFRNVFSLELRQRLWGPLEGSLFADAGNVGGAVADYGFHDMGYALGLGLRLQLPIGPVRVDAGWNPDRAPGDEAWVLHFAIGYPF
jgi:outer membrane protein assembly complex protein YaeT